MQKVMTQVFFSDDVVTSKGTIKYSDALYFTPEDFAKMSQEDIDIKKKERTDNFKNIIENPPKAKDPTKEELIEQKRQMEESKQNLELQLSELTTLIASKE